MYIAIISTNVETSDPIKEIQPAFDILGPVLEKFITVSDLYVPVGTYSDRLYISNSFDPTSHFESETENVMAIY